MEFKIKLLNGPQLEALFKKAPGIASEEYLKSLERVANYVWEEAVKGAPTGKYKGGGNLKQSIKVHRHGNIGYKVSVNSLYGVYVDQGTRPHVIVPRVKKYLAFQVNGQWVRTKRVNHPGTKPNPFFTNAVDKANDYANTEMDSAMTRVLNRITI